MANTDIKLIFEKSYEPDQNNFVPKMDMIIVCDAREFRSTNEAAEIFNELWNRYQPLYYFHHYIQNHGFTNQLWNVEDMRYKVSLRSLLEPEKSENIEFCILPLKPFTLNSVSSKEN